MLFHHICHIHCLDHPSVLKVLLYAKKYNKLFNGEKIATITEVRTELEIFNLSYSILKKLGYSIIVVKNNKLREVSHFFEHSLPALLEKTNKGLVFYNHSKGVSYHPESEDGIATSLWTDVLYHFNLDRHEDLPFLNDKYITFGSCIINKENFLYPFDIGEQFSYLGTFFWFRLESLVGKNFNYNNSIFYLEAFPGLLCNQTKAFNIGPEFYYSESPYKLDVWNKKGIDSDFSRKNSTY
jgi:hypothetical protein